MLLLHDRVDEWVMSSLTEFDGKPLQSVAKAGLDLSKIGGEAPKPEENQPSGEQARCSSGCRRRSRIAPAPCA